MKNIEPNSDLPRIPIYQQSTEDAVQNNVSQSPERLGGAQRHTVKNSGDCSNCLRVCPFTKPPGVGHDIARFFIKHFQFLDRFWVWLDDLMGRIPPWRYGKRMPAEKFWKSNKYLGKK